ncbi:MAG: energy-coupling factor ABC transporter ATP-binding protein [Streptococcaceae bacterium]|jgi:energy-coupling factor transport system ATP-binding protein|nr:energy-coupling factor ABC transporter ATP-binding protein [Streptococcaceae bacterium]
MAIQFEQVDFTYQPGTPFESKALFGIDLAIPDESYTAIVGHTGSGKSTLLQHLNGLLKPNAGRVVIGDFTITTDVDNRKLKAIRKKVGIVFQFPEAQLFDETVLKDVAFGPQNFGVSKEDALRIAAEKLEIVGISKDLFERSPFELSGGQMRRVAIAGVLAMNPEVLVLDEPTAGLDPKGRHEMMTMFYQLYKKTGLSVVLVTHLMDDVADFADYLYVLEQGRVIKSGKPKAVFQEVAWLKEKQLGVPQVTDFAKGLQDKGFKFDILPVTLPELIAELKGGMHHDG